MKPSMEKKHLNYFPKESNRIYDNKQSLYEYLLEKNKNHFSEIAITFGNLKYTYEELHSKIDEYAKALYVAGISKGDVVGLCIANSPEAIFLFYAINKLGAVTCQINPMDNWYKIMNDLMIVRPKIIITIQDCYGNIKKAQLKLGMDIRTIYYSAVRSVDSATIKALYMISQLAKGNKVKDSNDSLNELLKRGNNWKGIINNSSYEPDTLSNIVFTGGSSGTHKGVDLSSNGLNNLMDAYRYFNLLEPGEIFMGHLPLFMGFGILALHYALCFNTNLFLTFKALPNDFVSELNRIRPAAAFGGPIHWETLLNNPKAKQLDLSKLKEPVSGGEQLVNEKWVAINEVLRECGAPTSLWNGFGMSEMWSASALNRGNINTVGSVGVAYPCNNVKIVDTESEKELDYDEVGRYYVSGPSMMLGYHNNPEESDQVFKVDEKGVKWISTGDLAKICENGEIYFVGRTKRCFVSGVTNIYPEQIENLISDFFEVDQVIVTHIPMSGRQNAPIYHIKTRDNSIDKRKLSKKINTYVAERLGESAVAYEIVYTDQPLPVTANGKLDPKPLQAGDLKRYGSEK